MIETENIKSLVEESKNYLEAKVEIAKLEAAEKLSEGMAESAAQLIVGMVLLVFLFIFSIFISLWIGDIYGNYLYGFGFMSAIYLILIMLLLKFKKKLIKVPIQNKMIKYFFKSSYNAESD